MKIAETEMNKLFDKFYSAYNKDKWLVAKDLMLLIIKKEKKLSFFNYSRLSSCYYELREYKTALKYSQIAYKINPKSPLVLWDYAGVLRMVNKERKAIELLQRIKALDKYKIGSVITTTGTKWAKSLLNDCNFQIGHCYYQIYENTKAKKYFLKHLSLRKRGLHSLYSRKQVMKFLNTIEVESNVSKF